MQRVAKSHVLWGVLVLSSALVLGGCNKPAGSSNAKKTPDKPAPNTTDTK